MDAFAIMINKWKERALARLCSGALSAFRRIPLRMSPDDLRNLRVSFSQFGEDLLIFDHLFNRAGHPKGIYIDAGCFDPFRYSNTRLLSLLGWKGINIDAAEDVVEKFKRHRPKDHNVCAALSDRETTMQLVGKEGLATRRLAECSDPDLSSAIRTTTLETVLKTSPFAECSVDLLDIDCEMHDLEVLSGFPFDNIRPLLISVEAHTQSEMDDICGLLNKREYLKLGTRGPTHIFRDTHSLPTDLSPRTNIAEL